MSNLETQPTSSLPNENDDQIMVDSSPGGEKPASNHWRGHLNRISALFKGRKLEGISPNQTNENDAQNDNHAPEAVIKEDLAEASPRKFSRRDFLRMGALAGVAFASAEATRRLNTYKKAWEFAKPRVNQSEQLANILGYDIEELARRHGFEVRLSVDVGSDAPYIIHIGQQHPLRDLFQNSLDDEETSHIQQRIYDLLGNLISNSPEIHSVGVEAMTQEGSEDVAALKQVLDDLQNDNRYAVDNPEAVRSLINLHTAITDGLENNTYWFAGVVSYAISLKIREIKDYYQAHPDFVTQIDADNKKRHEDFVEFMQSESVFVGLLDQLNSLQEMIDSRNLIKHGSRLSYFAVGAVDMLLAEGKIDDLIYIEDGQLNRQALKVLDEIIVISEVTPDQFEKMSPEEVQELERRIEKLTIKRERVMFESREDFIISAVESWINSDGDKDDYQPNQKLIPVIFGAAHDLTNNVIQANSENRGKLGLIVLTPTELIDK